MTDAGKTDPGGAPRGDDELPKLERQSVWELIPRRSLGKAVVLLLLLLAIIVLQRRSGTLLKHVGDAWGPPPTRGSRSPTLSAPPPSAQPPTGSAPPTPSAPPARPSP